MASISKRNVIAGLTALNVLLAAMLVLGFIRNTQKNKLGPEFLIAELQLSRNQIQQYKQLLDSNKVAMQPLLGELKLVKQEFFNEIPASSFNEEALARKQAAINAIQNKIDRQMLQHLRQLYFLCNETQQKKLLIILHQIGEQMPK
ncbi:MAG: Spy/CpxP family protein refolding chaperone [Flammeovirgaceae bacterium]